MTASPQSELDRLRAKCAELEARLAATSDGVDPQTNDGARLKPGRNALFAAIQSTRMPMILTDPHQADNPIIFANRAFVELSGYAVEELIGRNCRFLQGDDTPPEAVDLIRQAIKTRTKIAIDVVNYSKSGRRFINELYISPVFAADGELLYFFGSQVDVSAYTDARLKLSLSLIERERDVLAQIAKGVPLRAVLEDLLRAVEAQSANRMRTSILILDEDGRRLRHGAAPSLPDAYNAAIDGIEIGDGVGSCGTAAARAAPVYVRDIATDPLWADFRDLALSHELRACWSTPVKAADGDMLGTFATYYDSPRSPTEEEIAAIGFVAQTAALAIERHRHDLELRRSEEMLSAANGQLREAAVNLERTVEQRTCELEAPRASLEVAFAAADMGGWDIDLASGSARRTSRHDRIFGYDALLPAWNVDIFLSHVQPEHRERVASAFDEAMRTGQLDVECPIQTAESKERWISAKGKLDYDAAGAPVRMSGVVFDVTDRNETEAQLLQSQKMEAVGQLTGGVAHDFNNLLTVIRGSVELLRRPDLEEGRRARYVDAIGETADRATKLTAQLLAFARRQALAPETFDCGRSLEEVGAIIRTLTGARINLRAITPDDACFVVADRGQFDTAVINMSINARDAMNGHGDLTIAVGPVSAIPAIRAHAPIVGDFVAVTITDTGSGMTPEQAERIFEPFYTTKGPGRGTGLGLSQVIGFAKQSGGDIGVDSTPGEGSAFTLYLPRAPSVEDDRAPVQAPARVDGEGACVLVVEDNDQVGEFAVQALTELGYRTRLAKSAEDALELLSAANPMPFDVVFSDVVMTGMDGLEMAREIRRTYKTLPVILTSGYSHVLATNGQQGFELLHKPYSIEQLSRVLSKAFAPSHSSSQGSA